MGDRFTEILLNPVRIRILQALILKERATAKQLGEALSDVPKASLYRHIGRMVACGMLSVVGERRVRGAVEREYAVNPQSPIAGYSLPDICRCVQAMLLSLMRDVERYFAAPGADIKKDGFVTSTALLLLDEEEAQTFFAEVGQAYAKVAGNQPDGKRRLRRTTLVSIPLPKEETPC